MRSRFRACLAIAAALLVPTALVGACTDGVTPDCSDAATQCGPNIDGSADVSEAQPLPESSTKDTSVADTSATDAGDLDADASDGL